jgi:hypothetical protein
MDLQSAYLTTLRFRPDRADQGVVVFRAIMVWVHVPDLHPNSEDIHIIFSFDPHLSSHVRLPPISIGRIRGRMCSLSSVSGVRDVRVAADGASSRLRCRWHSSNGCVEFSIIMLFSGKWRAEVYLRLIYTILKALAPTVEASHHFLPAVSVQFDLTGHELPSLSTATKWS